MPTAWEPSSAVRPSGQPGLWTWSVQTCGPGVCKRVDLECANVWVARSPLSAPLSPLPPCTEGHWPSLRFCLGPFPCSSVCLEPRLLGAQRGLAQLTAWGAPTPLTAPSVLTFHPISQITKRILPYKFLSCFKILANKHVLFPFK